MVVQHIPIVFLSLHVITVRPWFEFYSITAEKKKKKKRNRWRSVFPRFNWLTVPASYFWPKRQIEFHCCSEENTRFHTGTIFGPFGARSSSIVEVFYPNRNICNTEKKKKKKWERKRMFYDKRRSNLLYRVTLVATHTMLTMSEKRKYDLLNASVFFFLSFSFFSSLLLRLVTRTISRTQQLYNHTTIEKKERKKNGRARKTLISQKCTNG